jgi:phosphoglycolate phosphatase-like HAD superfamily hydrolase
VTDILIPASGDFDAWPRTSDVCLAVDWDGTCKDTMVPKWTQGFNLAITDIWPQLKPYQAEIDRTCYEVNIADPATAGVQRFVALTIMMQRWAHQGLPVPDLSRFFAAVQHVEASGEQHGVATYVKYRDRFGYDDSPLRWSEASDRRIARAVKNARTFAGVRDTLAAVRPLADVVVVSASKTEAVRQDILDEGMTDLFSALLAQDFLPKRSILGGLARRYDRVLFVADTQCDVLSAAAHGIPVYLIQPGNEDACWLAARPVFERFIQGHDCAGALLYS